MSDATTDTTTVQVGDLATWHTVSSGDVKVTVTALNTVRERYGMIDSHSRGVMVKVNGNRGTYKRGELLPVSALRLSFRSRKDA